MQLELLAKEFFPWGGFPYPFELAKLKQEEALPFLQATLDHTLEPIHSFFRQNHGCTQAELKQATHAFFEAAGVAPEPVYSYVDPQLGIIMQRDREHAALCLGSGCKSGMGAFFAGKSAVLNFGLQITRVGDCSGFGLAGRGENVRAEKNFLSAQCRLAAPLTRNTGIEWLEDSGYSGAWLTSTFRIEEGMLSVEGAIEGFRPPSDFLLTLFIRANACEVDGTHRLKPRSLDRYQGPAQRLVCEEVFISPEEGFEEMEVLPLAGDESYWGADFIVALRLKNDKFTCRIGRTT